MIPYTDAFTARSIRSRSMGPPCFDDRDLKPGLHIDGMVGTDIDAMFDDTG